MEQPILNRFLGVPRLGEGNIPLPIVWNMEYGFGINILLYGRPETGNLRSVSVLGKIGASHSLRWCGTQSVTLTTLSEPPLATFHFGKATATLPTADLAELELEAAPNNCPPSLFLSLLSTTTRQILDAGRHLTSSAPPPARGAAPRNGCASCRADTAAPVADALARSA